MNIFRTIASGKLAFREEFVSAFLAYLLPLKMDHGLGFLLFLLDSSIVIISKQFPLGFLLIIKPLTEEMK